jgi:hypothetical protein
VRIVARRASPENADRHIPASGGKDFARPECLQKYFIFGPKHDKKSLAGGGLIA